MRTLEDVVAVSIFKDTFLQVKSKYLEKSEVSAHIIDLEPNMNYVICIITLSEEPIITIDDDDDMQNKTWAKNVTLRNPEDVVASMLMRSPSSECTSFNTFRKLIAPKIKPNKVFDISMFLNRRMGLIVGCSLGFIVFFIMVSVLSYTKIKERKRIAKSDPSWGEMNDYHSMHSKEDVLENSNAASTDNILLGMTKNRKKSLELL